MRLASTLTRDFDCFDEKGGGVEGAGGFVLVFEVEVDLALVCESGEAFGEGLDLRRGVASVAAQAKAGVGGGGVDLGGDEIVRLRDAEGGVVLAEDFVGLFGEP